MLPHLFQTKIFIINLGHDCEIQEYISILQGCAEIQYFNLVLCCSENQTPIFSTYNRFKPEEKSLKVVKGPQHLSEIFVKKETNLIGQDHLGTAMNKYYNRDQSTRLEIE